MFLSVIDEHIGRRIVDLDTLVVCHVENLGSLIGREGAIATTWMPIGIDHRASQTIVASL